MQPEPYPISHRVAPRQPFQPNAHDANVPGVLSNGYCEIRRGGTSTRIEIAKSRGPKKLAPCLKIWPSASLSALCFRLHPRFQSKNKRGPSVMTLSENRSGLLSILSRQCPPNTPSLFLQKPKVASSNGNLRKGTWQPHSVALVSAQKRKGVTTHDPLSKLRWPSFVSLSTQNFEMSDDQMLTKNVIT
jgi:hypothetical protein